MKFVRVIVVFAALALVATACSSSDSLSVDDPWGRPSPSSASNAAFYMVIDGGAEDDTLIAAQSQVCEIVELHETQMSDGVMSMQHLPEGIPVPAGETVALEPGGLHVMCIGVVSPLVSGETVDVELQFAVAGEMTVQAEIRDE